MNNFKVFYSGACFETGNSREQVEKKVHDRVASLGEVFGIEASPIHHAGNNHKEENYVVSFEGEITVQAETEIKAENQAYDRPPSTLYVSILYLNLGFEESRPDPDDLTFSFPPTGQPEFLHGLNHTICP